MYDWRKTIALAVHNRSTGGWANGRGHSVRDSRRSVTERRNVRLFRAGLAAPITQGRDIDSQVTNCSYDVAIGSLSQSHRPGLICGSKRASCSLCHEHLLHRNPRLLRVATKVREGHLTVVRIESPPLIAPPVPSGVEHLILIDQDQRSPTPDCPSDAFGVHRISLVNSARSRMPRNTMKAFWCAGRSLSRE